MKVSVFGLGYVGCVSAACLAREGHDIVGVDVNPIKVDMINAGRSPIVEKDLDGILHEAVHRTRDGAGSLRATVDATEAVKATDISLICVGTPSKANGDLSLEYVARCAAEIGTALSQKSGFHVVVARSTMLPGSVEGTIVEEVERTSGKRVGKDFGAAMNPEFLRESTSVADFYAPPVTVIGATDERSAALIREMYGFLGTEPIMTDVRTAEMLKYANNAFHGLKVAFANEVGAICKAIGIDSHRVMDIFCMDRKLNISPYYLKPGYAFGGSCLPKDLRAVTYLAKRNDVDVPVLENIISSNRMHVQRAVDRVVGIGKKRVSILGLSFKAGTDDLRESPMVDLAEALIGKGFQLRIFDRNVSISSLFGANRDYIHNEIPHISSLMSEDMAEVIEHGEVVIIGNGAPEFREALEAAGAGKVIYDLVRITDEASGTRLGYEGICW